MFVLYAFAPGPAVRVISDCSTISGFFRLYHHIDIQMRFHPILPRQAEDTSRGTAALIDVCIDFNLYGRAAGGDCCVRRNHCLRCNAHEVRTATTRFSAIYSLRSLC